MLFNLGAMVQKQLLRFIKQIRVCKKGMILSKYIFLEIWNVVPKSVDHNKKHHVYQLIYSDFQNISIVFTGLENPSVSLCEVQKCVGYTENKCRVQKS